MHFLFRSHNSGSDRPSKCLAASVAQTQSNLNRCQPETTGKTMQGLTSPLDVASVIITISKWKTKTQNERHAGKSGCQVFETGHLIPEFSYPYLQNLELRRVTHVPELTRVEVMVHPPGTVVDGLCRGVQQEFLFNARTTDLTGMLISSYFRIHSKHNSLLAAFPEFPHPAPYTRESRLPWYRSTLYTALSKHFLHCIEITYTYISPGRQ